MVLPQRVVLVGLDNSGKGTLLKNLGIRVTNNCQIPEVVLNSSRFRVYLLKGHHRAKPLFGNYLSWADGAMFVVDIKDPDRFDEAAYELVRLRFQMPQVPIALICNKYDGPQDEDALQKWHTKLKAARLCFQDIINVPYQHSKLNNNINIQLSSNTSSTPTTTQTSTALTTTSTPTTTLSTTTTTTNPTTPQTTPQTTTQTTTVQPLFAMELSLLNLHRDIIVLILSSFVSDLDFIAISATCKKLQMLCNSRPLCVIKRNFAMLMDTWQKKFFRAFVGSLAGDKSKKSPAVEALLWINSRG